MSDRIAGGKRKHYKEYLRNPELSVPERTATRWEESGSLKLGIDTYHVRALIIHIRKR